MDTSFFPLMTLPFIGNLGNGVYPMVSVILLLIGWAVQNIDRFIENLKYCAKITGIDGYLLGRSLRLEGRILLSKHSVMCFMSDDLKGVLFHLETNLNNFKNLYNVESIDIATTVDTDNRKTIMVPVQSRWLRLPNTNNIDARVNYGKEMHANDRAGDMFSMSDAYKISILLRSKTASVTEMKNFIKDSNLEYKNYQASGSGEQMCFSISMMDDSNGDDLPIFKQTPFISKKTINNTYFKGKEDLIKIIQNFEDPKEREKRDEAGMPNTLGMLFYGKPGTGKTSFIKAIANMTKRHVILIRMDVILLKYNYKSIDVLESIMKNNKIGDLEIPQSKRLYVFEEADSWQEFLKQRVDMSSVSIFQPSQTQKKHISDNFNCKKSYQNQTDVTIVTELLGALQQSSTAANKPVPSTSMLGRLLELLDGVDEMYGRMCIMTTNFPDHLEGALVRAGRFGDIVHEFKPLTRTNISQILKQWFKEDISQVAYCCIEDDRWTQADIGKMLKSNTLNEILEILTTNNLKSPRNTTEPPQLQIRKTAVFWIAALYCMLLSTTVVSTRIDLMGVE